MEASRPWSPDPSWADPLIAMLALLCLWGVLLSWRTPTAKPPEPGPTVQGRVFEVFLGARIVAGPQAQDPFNRTLSVQELPHASDRAVAAVLLAEAGKLAEARRLVLASPRPSEAFQQAFESAYGTAPAPVSLALRQELGDGLAHRLLQARLAPEADRASLRTAALSAWMKRFALYSVASLMLLLAILAGLGTGIWLLVSRQPWPALYTWEMPLRALLIVLLGWWTSFFLLSVLIGRLAVALPFLRTFALPLAYLSHASVGIALICKAEGLSLQGLRQRVFPGEPWKSFGFSPLFVGLGLATALAVGWVLSPWLRGHANPQQELMDHLRRVQGWAPTLMLFFTVAVLAPCFEELLMRGVLMGWLRSRKGPAVALATSALVFGAVHLQPLALPTLSMLGAAFGLGVMRSGDLRTSILAHGLWNGTVFILLRLLA